MQGENRLVGKPLKAVFSHRALHVRQKLSSLYTILCSISFSHYPTLSQPMFTMFSIHILEPILYCLKYILSVALFSFQDFIQHNEIINGKDSLSPSHCTVDSIVLCNKKKKAIAFSNEITYKLSS